MASNDTRLLVAGVVALLALVVYISIAFANTRAGIVGVEVGTPSYPFAPWQPSESHLSIGSTREGGGVVVHANRGWKGNYGALVPTLITDPPNHQDVVVGLWMRGPGPTPFGIEIDEFRAGVSRYVVQTTVPAKPGWHHYTFRGRVEGRWLGLGVYVDRYTDSMISRQFAVRDLKVARHRR